MLIIDTNDERQLKKYEIDKRNAINSIELKGKYEVEDFVLVRITDNIGDADHILKSKARVPYIVKWRNPFVSTIQSILIKEKGYKFSDNEKLIEDMKDFLIYKSEYRDTIHFCLNGMVSNHAYGNFQNRKYVIIEPLKYHIGDNTDIHCLRTEDTYIKGETTLSDECTIMVNEKDYETLLEENPSLSNYNVVLYRGDQETAIGMFLASINIVPELIGSHYAIDSPLEDELNTFIKNISYEKNLSTERHKYTSDYEEENENDLILFDLWERDFYHFLFIELRYDENKINSLIDEIMNLSYLSKEKYFEKIISVTGLEKIKEIIKKYNDSIEIKFNNGEIQPNYDFLKKLKNKII